MAGLGARIGQGDTTFSDLFFKAYSYLCQNKCEYCNCTAIDAKDPQAHVRIEIVQRLTEILPLETRSYVSKLYKN